MKKLITLSFLVCMVAMTANTGCTGGGGTTNPITALPNLINFEIATVSSFVPGFGAAVSADAPDLGAGTYTVNYNLTSATTPADNLSNQTASMTVTGTTGTFNTVNIPKGGNVSISINSISNSSGSSPVTSNNTFSFSDSTGLMTATYTPSGGTAQNLRATDVVTTLAGTNLQISGTIWTPNLTSIDLVDLTYTGTGATSFNINVLPSTGTATYQVTGSSALINDRAVHGAITITSTTPTLTGAFTYTNMDSSVVAGTFSCPAP